MIDEELKYKIGVTLLPDIGDILGKKLIAYCGGVEAVFKENKRSLHKIPGIGKGLINSIVSKNVLPRAEEEVEFIIKNNIKPLFFLDKEYPQRLKQCIDSPVMIYYKGNTDLNKLKVLSFVGTRSSSSFGREICGKIISEFDAENLLIVSGLAYGIDVCAHKAALENGIDTTAVLAHGLDMIYPALHKNIAEKMCRRGGLITDFLSNTNPDKQNFPKRNRIVAGMCDAVVVIESARKGGSLITANIASSYNKDVFAVPGRPGDKYSKGCNFLIKANKAALVESAEDIILMMRWDDINNKSNGKQHELFVNLSEDEEKIISQLKGNGDVSVDILRRNSEINISKLAASLLNLEFMGIVKNLPGKMYRLL